MRITHLLQFRPTQIEHYILAGWNSGSSLSWTYQHCRRKGFDDKAKVISVWRDLHRQHGSACLPVMDPAVPAKLDERQQAHYGLTGPGKQLRDIIAQERASHAC